MDARALIGAVESNAMRMPPNRFLASIRGGQPQIGLWLSLASAFATEAVASSGFDWVLIDTDHRPTT